MRYYSIPLPDGPLLPLKLLIPRMMFVALVLTVIVGSLVLGWQHDMAELRKCTYTVTLPGGQEIKGLHATHMSSIFLTKDGREVRLSGSYVTTEEKAAE